MALEPSDIEAFVDMSIWANGVLHSLGGWGTDDISGLSRDRLRELILKLNALRDPGGLSLNQHDREDVNKIFGHVGGIQVMSDKAVLEEQKIMEETIKQAVLEEPELNKFPWERSFSVTIAKSDIISAKYFDVKKGAKAFNWTEVTNFFEQTVIRFELQDGGGSVTLEDVKRTNEEEDIRFDAKVVVRCDEVGKADKVARLLLGHLLRMPELANGIWKETDTEFHAEHRRCKPANILRAYDAWAFMKSVEQVTTYRSLVLAVKTLFHDNLTEQQSFASMFAVPAASLAPNTIINVLEKIPIGKLSVKLISSVCKAVET